jgi:glucose/arabinose dehydrogenase
MPGKFARPRVGVSKCLGFAACRYKGQTIPDEFVQSLWQVVTTMPADPAAMKTATPDGDQPSGRILRMPRALERQFGRLRGLAEGPDGCLYMTTSNRDSRGVPAPTDDWVLRLVPAAR